MQPPNLLHFVVLLTEAAKLCLCLPKIFALIQHSECCAELLVFGHSVKHGIQDMGKTLAEIF